jgi:hypothetical protein
LPHLRAQHPPKVMRFLTLHQRALPIKLFNKKSPPHATILSQMWIGNE